MAHSVHLDYASTAPLRPNVRKALAKAIESDPFDPRRLYEDAINTRYAIEDAREKVAMLLGCDPFEVIFTSSHSESLAMFAFGCLSGDNPEIVGTPYDSEVIHKTWSSQNARLELVEGNKAATLELDNLAKLVTPTTVGATIPYAHPDTGTLQDLNGFVKTIREINSDCLIHVDARIAVGNVEIDFAELGVDAMSVDPVTFGGPAGISALILSRKSHLHPLLAGATQERARRAGLENYIGIAGFGSACEQLQTELKDEISRYKNFKETVVEILDSVGAKRLECDLDLNNSVPNIACAYFEGVAASAVVAELNRKGINIHAGSSCGSEEFEPSKQLAPVTLSDSLSESVYRISWGWNTTTKDLEALQSAMEALPFATK